MAITRIWSTRHCGLGQEVACCFQCWKNSTCLVWLVWHHWCYWCENGWVCSWGKIIFYGVSFSYKLNCSFYIISIVKTTISEKNEVFISWFILWSVFPLRLLFISINLTCGFVWNTAAMSKLVLLAATWKC